MMTCLGQEESIIEWICQIVEDGEASLDTKHHEPDQELNYGRLGFAVVQLWAYIMKANTQWGIVAVMGHALEEYASICQ